MPSLGWRKCTLSARDVCTGESSGGSSKADCCDGSLFSGECLAEKSRRVVHDSESGWGLAAGHFHFRCRVLTSLIVLLMLIAYGCPFSVD